MDTISKIKPLANEFFRYFIVGGTAFLVDFGVLFFSRSFIFGNLGDIGVYIATALGFISGLVYNYIFSLIFVFKSAKEQNKGKSAGAFLVFALIGMIGLALTESGMYFGYNILRIDYLVVKVFVAAVVLIWNYAGRKILIFK